MRTVFLLSSGRSGTTYLAQFVRANARCTVRHEPYLDIGNPTLFGRPIHEGANGEKRKVLELLRRKKEWIEKNGRPNYFEANHALIKAAHDLLPLCFPEAWYVHAVRNPLYVAKSEANREELLDRLHFPWRRYVSTEGKSFLRWALTGEEAVYRFFDDRPLSRFQWYVVQWIEIENRIVRLLRREGGADRCFFLSTPADFKDGDKLEAMLSFLKIERRAGSKLDGRRSSLRRNRTPGKPTLVTKSDHREFRAVIDRLPDEYLEIFAEPPYDALEWRHVFGRGPGK